MNYFTPADLKQLEATYNYTARAGLGFAITPDNEQVFVPAREVERLNLIVGDMIRVWATDNFASPHTAHYASRWRAVMDNLFVHFYLCESESNIVFDAFFIKLIKLKRNKLNSFVFDILQEIQSVS